MNVRPRDVISRYVDSGIPVILGLQQAGTAIGHGVVAVGTERTDNVDPATFAPSPTAAEYVTHFLVNDDQRGAYCRLPVNAADKSVDYPFCLETDIKFLLVPLPEKVFMTAEAAELVARGMLFQVAHQRKHLATSALPPGTAWDEDPTFYDLLQTNSAFARTYLTYGWKYKTRMLRNCSSQQAKAELLGMQLPKYVWVTEFSRPEETAFLDPCKRLIRAHAVVDATGSRLWDSTLFVNAPGLTTAWQYDPRSTSVTPNLIVAADLGSSPYWPKIRGMADYASCLVS
ncbi:MAG: hypothetical protein CL949_05700 [Erythrobacter sp.]|nr:hypothetical protein [Erythrobacter sp.]